jgi:phage terminase large subunit-like protein
VTVKSTGARLRVESADAGSAFGRVPYFVVADELAQWPTARAARTLWEAITSGLPKRRDSRLVVLTTAGDPAHWSARVIGGARESERWRVSEVPGPLPWADADDLAEQRRLLPESAYARLHLNRWTAAEDRLVSAEDLRACVTLDGPLEYDTEHRYVIGLDLGLKNDRTVLTVAHSERRETSGPLVVLDRLHVLQGSRAHPVQLSDVERLALEASRAYGFAPIRLDPWQAVGLAQRLRDRGIKVEEWAFTAQSVGRLGQTLHLLLRDHRLALPDDENLLDELMTVRLRESAPGVYRLDHDAGQHDDRAISLGLAALALTERPDSGGGGISVPHRIMAAMKSAPSEPTAYSAVRLRGQEASIASSQKAQTPAQRRAGLGLAVPGSANDPFR